MPDVLRCQLYIIVVFMEHFYIIFLSFVLTAVSYESSVPRVREVEIDREGSSSLGLSIAGGLGSPLGDVPLIIASMQPDGAAAKTARLQVSFNNFI